MVKKLLFPLLKLGLIAMAFFFLYQKFSTGDFIELSWSWTDSSFIALFLFFSFGLLNLVLDAKAWQEVQGILQKISLKKALEHNFKSYGLAFISPMNSGEIVGRYIIQEETENRKKALFLTFWTHAPKMFSKIILVLSILPLLFQSQLGKISYLALPLISIIILVYLNLDKVLSWIGTKNLKQRKLEDYIVAGQPKLRSKIKLLVLNGSRFLIYSLQLTFVLWALNLENISLEILLSIPVYYLLSALIPSYSGLDFLIKGTFSLYYFEMFSSNQWGFALATSLVWLLNWAIPSIIGLLSLKKIEIDRIRRRRA